jgi:cytosine/adenosine deaminase-related metal-dependent hydrolase
VVEERDAILASTARIVDTYHDGNMVQVVLAPCSPFSVTPELMRESAAFARERGLRLHTHLAETVEENADCLERFGKRPLDLVEEWGWLADDVWVAHGIHFDDTEVKRLGAAGTGVAHCPSSNARLGAGTCRVTDLEAAGVPVGLGVDGAASNEVGRLFPELRQSLYAARLRAQRADAFMPADALRVATSGGAACVGRPELGRLEPGAAADLAVWPGDDLADIDNPVTALVLGPDRPARHTLVGGRFVVRDGDQPGVDRRRARDELQRRHHTLFGSP